MRRFLFTLLLLLFSAAAFGGAKNHSTVVAIACTPDPVALDATTSCTATVTDIGGSGGQINPPEGSVTFSTTASGAFSAASCVLVSTGNGTSSACSVSYTPSAVDSGTHPINGSYSGGFNPAIGPGIIWDPSSGNGTVGVNYPAPTISAISPTVGNRGEVVSVTVTGSGFVSGWTSLDLGANISVSALTVVNATELTATLTIATAATTGLRDVVVSNAAPGGGIATLTNGFDVRNPVPGMNSLMPAATEIGSGALVVTIDGAGFVPESIAWFDGATRPTTFVNSTQLQMDLSAADTSALGSFPVYVVNSAPGGGTSNTLQFSVVLSGGSFDTVESGAAPGSNMYTKLAGTAFSFDLLATDVSRTSVNTSFTGTVKIELLDAADDSVALDANGCRASWTLAQTLPDAIFGGADNGRISINTSYANALRVARFRISYPATGTPSHVGCSADGFSIRPLALVLSSSLNNDANTGTPIHPAGTAFSMTATAIPGYDGVPQLGVISATGPTTSGVVSGSFSAANSATGISTGSSFGYDEVGNFRFAAEELFDDNFTAVDQPDDCTADFSNSLVLGKYGCSFGNTAATQWIGRFTPAYFDVAVTDGCTDDTGFTYSGQPFLVTISAREANGAITQNYAGNFSKLVTLSDAGDTANFGSTNQVAAVDFSTGPDPGIAADIDVTYTFAVATTPFQTVTLRATDTDNVSSIGHLEESTEIRSARLVLGTASAITTSDALLSVMLQAWQEILPSIHEWAVHGSDTTCTAPVIGDFNVVAGSGTGNLDDTETAVTSFFFNAGEGALTLAAPGAGNDGSVDIEVTTDAWLHFDWNNTGTRTSPLGKVSFFEIFETEEGLIESHEVIQ